MPNISVAFTADHVTEASAEFGTPAESGWIDPDYSMKEIYAEREDVQIFSFPTLEEAEEYIEQVIGEFEPTEGENYYAVDTQHDMVTGDYWRYAGHIIS